MLIEEFPRLDLRFAKKRNRSISIPRETVHNADRIVVWANFVDHSTQTQLPREKVTVARGGMSTLRGILESWQASMGAIEGTAKPSPIPPSGANDVVDPRPPEDRIFFPKLTSELARSMNPGDRLWFAREDDDIKRWRQGYSNKFHHYRKTYGINLEYKVWPDAMEVWLPEKEPAAEPVATAAPPVLAAPTPEPQPSPEPLAAVTPPPVTFAYSVITRNRELTSTDIMKLRIDPRSHCDESHILDEHIGWLFRAWEVLMSDPA
jgi:hypothetical protein